MPAATFDARTGFAQFGQRIVTNQIVIPGYLEYTCNLIKGDGFWF
jgi:hypothetical protein